MGNPKYWIEDDQEFSTNLDFKATGIQGKEISRVIDLCTLRRRSAYRDPLWMALRSRENLHLYIARHGRDYVRACRLAEPEHSSIRSREFHEAP